MGASTVSVHPVISSFLVDYGSGNKMNLFNFGKLKGVDD